MQISRYAICNIMAHLIQFAGGAARRGPRCRCRLRRCAAQLVGVALFLVLLARLTRVLPLIHTCIMHYCDSPKHRTVACDALNGRHKVPLDLLWNARWVFCFVFQSRACFCQRIICLCGARRMLWHARRELARFKSRFQKNASINHHLPLLRTSSTQHIHSSNSPFFLTYVYSEYASVSGGASAMRDIRVVLHAIMNAFPLPWSLRRRSTAKLPPRPE
jgi:hypothetical protein